MAVHWASGNYIDLAIEVSGSMCLEKEKDIDFLRHRFLYPVFREFLLHFELKVIFSIFL